MSEINNQNNDNLLNEHMLEEPIISDDTVVDIELNDSISSILSSTSSSEQCAICLDPIIKDEECINNCGHIFCKPCLDQYLDSGKTECPLCRQPIQYFEHNSEHFRLILKKVNERQIEQGGQILRNPNHLVVDRKKYNIYRFILFGLFITNIIDMFMGDVSTNEQNLLLRKYQECERNNTDLQNRVLNLEDDISFIYPQDDNGYSFYFIIDKLRGLQSECYLPTNIINTCFNIF
jgi:hypothetical protein